MFICLQVFDDDKQAELQKAYDQLKDVSKKKINCIKTVLEICSLEEHCSVMTQLYNYSDIDALHIVLF